MGHRRVIDPAGPFGEFSVKKGSSVRRGQDLNLAQTTGDKFIRFFFSLLFLLYPTCGSARIVVLTLEKRHVFDRADPMPPL